MKVVAPLNDMEIQTLTDMHRFHPSRRARMRAHGILLSHQGWAMGRIAAVYQVSRYAVSEWIERWHSAGLVGLYDHPRSGRPPSLTPDEQPKVDQYLQDHPKDLKQVVHVLEQETSKRVSTKTLKRLIKKHRYVWKRLRKTPAKAPEPATYQRAQERIASLQAREQAGACELWYFDASGSNANAAHFDATGRDLSGSRAQTVAFHITPGNPRTLHFGYTTHPKPGFVPVIAGGTVNLATLTGPGECHAPDLASCGAFTMAVIACPATAVATSGPSQGEAK